MKLHDKSPIARQSRLVSVHAITFPGAVRGWSEAPHRYKRKIRELDVQGESKSSGYCSDFGSDLDAKEEKIRNVSVAQRTIGAQIDK